MYRKEYERKGDIMQVLRKERNHGFDTFSCGNALSDELRRIKYKGEEEEDK